MYKLLIAFAATLMSATGALAHGDHDDQAERSVEQVARDNVVKLVTKGQLAPSWSKAKVLSVTSRMRGGARQDVVTLRNNAEVQASRKTLFIVLAADRGLISSSHKLQ